jgi:hypothetical protein
MNPCHTTTARRIRRHALTWILAARASSCGSLLARRPHMRPNCTVTLYLTLLEHTPQAIERRFSQGWAA